MRINFHSEPFSPETIDSYYKKEIGAVQNALIGDLYHKSQPAKINN